DAHVGGGHDEPPLGVDLGVGEGCPEASDCLADPDPASESVQAGSVGSARPDGSFCPPVSRSVDGRVRAFGHDVRDYLLGALSNGGEGWGAPSSGGVVGTEVGLGVEVVGVYEAREEEPPEHLVGEALPAAT